MMERWPAVSLPMRGFVLELGVRVLVEPGINDCRGPPPSSSTRRRASVVGCGVSFVSSRSSVTVDLGKERDCGGVLPVSSDLCKTASPGGSNFAHF